MSICDTHPHVVKEWHPTKNGDLQPTQVTFGSQQHIWWVCENKCAVGCEHIWNATVSSRCNNYRRSGCPFCKNKKICYHKSLEYTHPHIAKEWHPTKNGTLKPSDVTKGSSKRVWWLCLKNCKEGCKHEWQTKIEHRTTRNSGCIYCLNKICCVHSSIVTTHPEIAKEWHPTKNSKTPDVFSYGSELKTWWQCSKKKEHEWITAISHRTFNNTGCPKCVNKTETKLLNYLLPHFQDIQTEFIITSCKNIKNLRFDFCIPSQNIIIELDGEQHFKETPRFKMLLAERQQRDIYKMNCAIEKGYKIIRINQEDVYDNGIEWLDTHVLPKIKHATIEPQYISKNETLYDIYKHQHPQQQTS